MKVRNGFVSNSSSSSFIIVTSNIPKSPAQLKTWMFGRHNIYNDIGIKYSTTDIAGIIYNIIDWNKKANINEIQEELKSSCDIEWLYDIDDGTYDEYINIRTELLTLYITHLYKNYPAGGIYIFDIEDKPDIMKPIESGRIFVEYPIYSPLSIDSIQLREPFLYIHQRSNH